MTEAPRIAAVICPDEGGADAVVAAVAARLAAAGLRLAGHVQRSVADDCGAVTMVEDVATGALTPITQDLGRASAACALDPAALAGVAGQLLARLEDPVDLLIVNRFGRGEAEGGGLRAAIERAVLAGVPVLVMLRPPYRAAWEAFTGGTADSLPAEDSAIAAWVARALAAPA